MRSSSLVVILAVSVFIMLPGLCQSTESQSIPDPTADEFSSADEPSDLRGARGIQTSIEDVEVSFHLAHRAMDLEYRQRIDAASRARNKLLAKVDGFWAKTLVSSPEIQDAMGPRDRDVLQYVREVDVVIMGDTTESDNIKCILTFEPNPYLKDERVWFHVGEYGDNGRQAITQSGVSWLAEQRPIGKTFLRFFETHDDGSDRADYLELVAIGHCLRFEVCMHPLALWSDSDENEAPDAADIIGGATE